MEDDVASFTLDQLIVNGSTTANTRPSKQKPTGNRHKAFIKGPIDLAWLAEARKLGVTAFWLGLLLWYLRGLRKTDRFVLSNQLTGDWGIEADAKSRALRKLEVGGLVQVERRGKRNPTVTLLTDRFASSSAPE